MTWQILEGASSIPITLFEAVADLDAGPIHLQRETRYRAMSWWMSAVLYRPAPRLSFAWPGVMAISGLWPQPNHKLVLLVITGGANLPIHYLTLICLWLSSLTCFVLWIISVTRLCFSGVDDHLFYRLILSLRNALFIALISAFPDKNCVLGISGLN